MNKVVFSFIACIFILLQLEQIQHPVFDAIKLSVSIGLILTLGVSHGAIDNLLYMQNKSISNHKFIAYYLMISALNIGVWLILPEVAFLLFLTTSAYHFGQSQLIDLQVNHSWISRVAYFSWGSFILSLLIYFNQAEISALFANHQVQLVSFDHIQHYAVYYVALFGISTFLTLFFELKDDAKFLQKMLIESYQILLIAIAFYLFSTLVGFTLYFIILHSFKVLIQEYDFLKRKTSIKGLLHFIQLLTPFTMLSIVGMAIIFSVIHFLGLNVSIPLLLLILVSSITLPHSYVMDIFYQRGGSGQVSQ